MLSQRHHGVTLIELMVALAIAGLLIALGAPAFANWLTNMRVRGTAEAMLSGVQLARSEAITRNDRVRFQLTSTLDDSCALSTSGTNWVVDLVTTAGDSVEGACGTAPSDTIAPHILHKRTHHDGGGSTKVSAGESSLVFNGLGRVVPTPADTVVITVKTSDDDDCITNGGEIACLQIQISTAGQIRMCNPAFAAGTAQAC